MNLGEIERLHDLTPKYSKGEKQACKMRFLRTIDGISIFEKVRRATIRESSDVESLFALKNLGFVVFTAAKELEEYALQQDCVV